MSVGKRARLGSRRAVWAAAFAGWIAAASFAAPANAGSFRVNPVHITLPADRQAASLTIENSDAAPVSVRILAYAWKQVDGVDVYTPTDNVIASPPIFTIQARKMQLVRIGLKNRALASAYRVIFEEIPRNKPGEGQIQVVLRLDLPLYLLPKGGAKPELSWSAWRDRSGDLFVEGRNSGLLHGQVLELSAKQDASGAMVSKEMGVVLPGSARRWKIGKNTDLKVGAPLTLSIRSSTSETRTQLVLEQR